MIVLGSRMWRRNVGKLLIFDGCLWKEKVKDDLSVEVGYYENEYGFVCSKIFVCNGYNIYSCYLISLLLCFYIIIY